MPAYRVLCILVAQTAIFDPLGLWGQLYWYALYPLHRLLFAGMLRRIARAGAEEGLSRPAPLAFRQGVRHGCRTERGISCTNILSTDLPDQTRNGQIMLLHTRRCQIVDMMLGGLRGQTLPLPGGAACYMTE
jgi:hypothetical protein